LIQNIVFDMGGVIVEFNPRAVLASYLDSREDIEYLYQEVFKSTEWVEMDKGTLTAEQAARRILSRLRAEYHPLAERLIMRWFLEMPPKPDMEQLVRELKREGYRIYLLSNTSRDFYAFKDSVPAFGCFDGFVISADHFAIKPDPSLYKILFSRFGLPPEDCFFVDDSPANVETGASFGMKTHCFADGDISALRRAMRSYRIKVKPPAIPSQG